MELVVKDADDSVADADAVGDPVIAGQSRVNLPTEATLSVSRWSVDEQAASAGCSQPGERGALARAHEPRKCGCHVLRLHLRQVRELPAEHRRIRVQVYWRGPNIAADLHQALRVFQTIFGHLVMGAGVGGLQG